MSIPLIHSTYAKKPSPPPPVGFEDMWINFYIFTKFDRMENNAGDASKWNQNYLKEVT